MCHNSSDPDKAVKKNGPQTLILQGIPKKVKKDLAVLENSGKLREPTAKTFDD